MHTHAEQGTEFVEWFCSAGQEDKCYFLFNSPGLLPLGSVSYSYEGKNTKNGHFGCIDVIE